MTQRAQTSAGQPLTEEHSFLVAEHFDWACEQAVAVYRSWKGTGVTEDECKSEAAVFLMELAPRYEGKNGASFQTFAYRRIRGAVVDFLKAEKKTRASWTSLDEAAQVGARFIRTPSGCLSVGPMIAAGSAGPESHRAEQPDEQSEKLDAVLAGWMPQMHFPAGEEDGLRQKIRRVCAVLADAGCDLAVVLAAASRHALLHDLREFQLDRRKREPTELERLSVSIRTAAFDAAECAIRLRTALAALESLASKNTTAYGRLLRLLHSGNEFEGWLSTLASGLQQTVVEPRNSSEDLIRWRTQALRELVQHFNENNVKQPWAKLSLLISAFRPASVALSLVGDPARVEVRYADAALLRRAKQLQSEYEYACRKIAATGSADADADAAARK